MNIMQTATKKLLCGCWTADANALPDEPPEIPMETEDEEPDGFLTYKEHGLTLRVPLKNVTRVGSGYNADCVIDSPFIRENHAVIIFENDCYSIKNLSGEGEIRVNGMPLSANGVKTIPNDAIIALPGREMKFQRWSNLLPPAPD